MQWSDEKIKAFRAALLNWYDSDKRDLPWRRDTEPYHVLVSETMLQQTQVKTVIPYYERFIKQFPDIEALANAPEEAVLKAWEGLGYYSRARNLQKAAKQLLADFNGEWPTDVATLQTISGIGPYTAGAIASIAFGAVEPAIDGNAYRVFARLLRIDADIAQPATRKIFDAAIRPLIDPKRPGDFNQAVMDLGSSYMRAKDPDTANSPVADFDASFQDGVVLQYPVKTKKSRPKRVDYAALVVETPSGLLLVQRPTSGMLARLWMFPLVLLDDLEDNREIEPQLADAFFELSGERLEFSALPIKPVKHTFTHQQWHIQLFHAKSQTLDTSILPGRLVPLAEFNTLALPKVQDKLAKALTRFQEEED